VNTKMKMNQVRKGEVVRLSFTVHQAMDEAGVVVLKGRYGEKPLVTVAVNAPELSVEVSSHLIVTNDIIHWDGHYGRSAGWGRVMGIHDKWFIVSEYDAHPDRPFLVPNNLCTRDPDTTEERDELRRKSVE